MFKLVVLSALLAVAVAAPAPGFLHGFGLPAATSYTSRVDVHSKPLLTTYVAPVVTKTLVAAPALSYALPSVHGYGLHGLHSPVISSYGYGLGHGLSHGYGW